MSVKRRKRFALKQTPNSEKRAPPVKRLSLSLLFALLISFLYFTALVEEEEEENTLKVSPGLQN